MKIEVKLDEKCQETKIVILTNQMTEQLNDFVQHLSIESLQGIAGFDNDSIQILKPYDIVRIYAAVGKVFAVTEKKEFVLRMRLYELEEKMSCLGFIRISNSEIINIHKAIRFDLSTAGTIRVLLSNGDHSFVSRRYVKKIKKAIGI